MTLAPDRPPELPEFSGVPVVPWDAFLPRVAWRQGEHVALVGPTGQGKTTLGLALMARRDWRVILGTKPRDRTLRGLGREGYVTIRHWPPPVATSRVILWPKWRTPIDTPRQRTAIGGCLNDVFRSGGWCVFADDVQYLSEQLRLGGLLDMVWLQARAIDVSLMAATQRPRHVPRNMWTQSTHVFIWGTADQDDLRALPGVGGANSKVIRALVAELPPFVCLYINTRTRAMCITRAPRRGGGG